MFPANLTPNSLNRSPNRGIYGNVRRPPLAQGLAVMDRIGTAAWRAFAAGLILTAGCDRADRADASRAGQPTAGSIQLGDVTDQTGITFRHTDGSSGRRYIIEAMSAGLALFDYNGDGLVDIYFLSGSPPTLARRRV